MIDPTFSPGELHIIARMEKKLQELMTKAEYEEFTITVAKEAIMLEAKDTNDKEFADFMMSNLDAIINGELDDAIFAAEAEAGSETS